MKGLPPHTPFSPSPISDKNTSGSMNSIASITCNTKPVCDLVPALEGTSFTSIAE